MEKMAEGDTKYLQEELSLLLLGFVDQSVLSKPWAGTLDANRKDRNNRVMRELFS